MERSMERLMERLKIWKLVTLVGGRELWVFGLEVVHWQGSRRYWTGLLALAMEYWLRM